MTAHKRSACRLAGDRPEYRDMEGSPDGDGQVALPMGADEIERKLRARNTFVIGLTGPFSSGCTTAAHYLSEAEPSFTKTKLSDVLRTVFGDQADRSVMQDHGNELRKNEGDHALVVRALGALVSEADTPERIVIDGIRNLGEVRWLQHALGDRFALFAITGDFEERYERRREKALTTRQFQALDKRDQGEDEDYGQQVNRCVDFADVLIPNPTVEEWQIEDELAGKTLEFAALVGGREGRYATDDEMLMNLAHGATHGSRCLKRQVGAVIARENEALASGYNENPNGLAPCIEQYGTCFRDIIRHEQYEALADEGAKCPYCGEPMQRKLVPPWLCHACGRKLDDAFFPDRAMKWCTALHAEERALINAAGKDLEGTTLYATTFPCMLCAEKIIHAGIGEVVYVEAYPDASGLLLFEEAGVPSRRFQGVRSRNFERSAQYSCTCDQAPPRAPSWQEVPGWPLPQPALRNRLPPLPAGSSIWPAKSLEPGAHDASPHAHWKNTSEPSYAYCGVYATAVPDASGP